MRLAEFGRSGTMWSDMPSDYVYSSLPGVGECFTPVQHRRSASSRLPKSATMTMTMKEQVVLHERHSSMTTVTNTSQLYQQQYNRQHTSNPHSHSMTFGLDLSNVVHPINRTPQTPRGCYPVKVETVMSPLTYECNDSSSGDSARDTPVEPTVDLPSVNFEQLLEGKCGVLINDSFHSDQSLNRAGPASDDELLTPQDEATCASFSVDYDHDHTSSLEILNSKELLIESPTKAVDESLMSQCSTSTCSGESLPSDICIRVDSEPVAEEQTIVCSSATGTEATVGDADRTPTQDHPNVVTKVYCNQEVRLRGSKKRTTSLDPPATFYAGTSTNSKPPIQSQSAPNISRLSPEASPIWKRKSALSCGAAIMDDSKRMSNISETSESESFEARCGSRDRICSSASSDTTSMSSAGDPNAPTYNRQMPNANATPPPTIPPKITDRQRKRLYRIGLNLFNK